MPTQKENKSLRKVLLVLAVFLLIIGAVAGARLWKYLTIGVQVVTNDKIELKQAEEKRINVLLLGVGGGAHEGPDLTDTIIFATIDPNKKESVLVSIPRDMWVQEISAKINTVYVYGEKQEKGGGLILAKAMVSKILGQEIDYAVRIDFDGFVKAIDKMGGIEVDVERTFDDYAYPVTGKEEEPCGFDEVMIASLSAQIATGSATESESFPCRYEHLHFDQGVTQMDGETALKYVRSRHALGPEGSDFARSKRQERVISAVKDKVFSLNLLLNPVNVMDIITVIKDSIVMDIREEEYDDFVRLAQKFQKSKIRSAIIDTGDYSLGREGLLTNPPTGVEFRNQWVLIPEAGNGEYGDIQEYVKCEIERGNCMTTPTPTPLKKITPNPSLSPFTENSER